MPVCAYCACTRIEPVCVNSVGPSGYHKFSLPVQHHSNVGFVHKILSTVFFHSILFTEGQVSVTDTMRVGLQIPGS